MSSNCISSDSHDDLVPVSHVYFGNRITAMLAIGPCLQLFNQRFSVDRCYLYHGNKLPTRVYRAGVFIIVSPKGRSVLGMCFRFWGRHSVPQKYSRMINSR